MLLLGIIAGVVLIKNPLPQIFRSRATSPPIVIKSIDGKPLALKSGIPITADSTVKLELTSPLDIQAADKDTSFIQITAPAKAEVLQDGTTYRIKWRSNKVDKVGVFYSIVEGKAEPITGASYINNSGFLDWKLNLKNDKKIPVKLTIIGHGVKNPAFDASYSFYVTPRTSKGTQSSDHPVISERADDNETSAPVSVILYYRIAENPADLDKASFLDYTASPMTFNYEFKNKTLGKKFIWVEFKSDKSIVDRRSIQIELIKAPLADLDVTYIERTPRYNRYCVQYDYYSSDVGRYGLPKLCPDTENQKRWPDAGEEVTYKAHILNKGPDTFNSGFKYQWIVDEHVVSKGEFTKNIGLGKEIVLEFKTKWPQSRQKIQFRIDPNIADRFDANNSLDITSHDLTLSYWVERAYYDLFNKTANIMGTYSFEDWIQSHFSIWNNRLLSANKYPGVPQGAIDRVRLDKLVISDQLDDVACPPNPRSQDPDLFFIDGRWQTTDGTCDNAGITEKAQNYVNEFASHIDWGLVHEMTHQIGIIDLYRLGIPPDPVNFGIHVTDINGQIIPVDNMPTGAQLFPNGGLMGGGDTTPYNDGTYLESHTLGGLNAHAGKRRGYYGEYLYDTPNKTILKIVDTNGSPIANADVALYQKNSNGEEIDNSPEQKGKTDNSGLVDLTNRPVRGTSTQTGHTLKDNPFGQINEVGTNGTMLLKVTVADKEGYGWLFILDLNLAYWMGNKDTATVTVRTNYPLVSKKITPTPTATPSPIPIPTPSVSPTNTPSSSPTPISNSGCAAVPALTTDTGVLGCKIMSYTTAPAGSKDNTLYINCPSESQAVSILNSCNDNPAYSATDYTIMSFSTTIDGGFRAGVFIRDSYPAQGFPITLKLHK